jgi:hypothetical protein
MAAVLGAPRLAHAQAVSPNVAVAEKLFREAQELLEQGSSDESKIRLACDKLTESQRLQPATGTLLNLAVCHEKEKKTASAWTEYTQVAGQSARGGQTDRAEFAKQHAAALESQLCRLRLEMATPPPGTDVKIDGQSVGGGIWGTDIPLDPGGHAVIVSAPSKKAWERTIVLGPDKTLDREEVPPLADMDAPAAGATAGEVPGASVALVPDVVPSSSDRVGGRRTLGYVVGGIGVAALGTGIVFIVRGAQYSSRSDNESSEASSPQASPADKVALDADASNDHSTASSNTAVGAVMTGVGAVGVGVGLYLVLSARHQEAPSTAGSLRVLPALGPRERGVSLALDF